MKTLNNPELVNETEQCIERMIRCVKFFCRCFFKKKDDDEFDSLIYTSGESEDEIREDYLTLGDDDRADHIISLWMRTIAKARGAVAVINVFGDLNRRIYLHGSNKTHDYIDE